jgi:N-acetylmuramic acid 6-phosphate (MurNAc-6-P) etherase
VVRTFPLLIRQVRVEVTQELNDGEAEQLLRQVESTVRSAIIKVQDELQRKYPNAQLKITVSDY